VSGGLFPQLQSYAAAQRELASATARTATVSWTVNVDGAGQAIVDIDFATFFLEQPIFTWGSVAAAPLAEEELPLCNAIVRSWSQTDRGFHIGANVGLVVWQPVEPPSGQEPVLTFHLQFVGIATPSVHGLEG